MNPPLSTLSRYLNWGKLMLLAAPVAIILQRQPDIPLGVWGCPIRWAIGCPCPTCGMTRAVLSICHGQWQAAWNYHAFSFLLVGASVLVAAHAVLELIGDRSIRTFYTRWQQPKFYVILAVAYFLYYFYRLVSQGIP